MILNEQVADPENVRENFKKMLKAISSMSLPDQAGNTGKFLSTNGEVLLWDNVTTNLDGGFAAETYLSTQKADGGNA